MIAKMMNNEKGVTRLMVATMLVGCLTVAGLVAWVTFSPEEAAQPLYAGPTGEDSLQLRSAVLAQGDGTGIDSVSFAVQLSGGTDPINLTPSPQNVVVISYEDGRPRADDLFWSCTEYGPGDGDYMLEAGEMFNLNAYTPSPRAGTAFEIQVITPDGKILRIERTIPDELTPVMNLR